MRRKIQRFKANQQLSNLIEPGKTLYRSIKGAWNNLYFQNNQPITVEIGCGHGSYTLSLGRIFPKRNFIGIDIKGDRLWKGATMADEMGLSNVAFLRINLTQLLDFFAPNEIEELWITFPDPRPNQRDAKRRLTSLRFLQLYASALKNQGRVHLKTDSRALFDYTMECLRTQGINTLAETCDLYASPLLDEQLNIQTTYEKRFLAQGFPIHYLCFVLTKDNALSVNNSII